MTMRVGMYYSNQDVRVEEMPVPEIGPEEVLLKVEACGICGSDLMEWYRRHKAPLVLGHEVAGVVAEIGSQVTAVRPGDRVAVAHHVPCLICNYCLAGHQTVCETLRTTNFYPGGFSEYLQVPAINVERGMYVLPDRMSFAEGTFVEPLACVLRGQKAAGIRTGASVVVIGCGIAGLLHIRAARASGVEKIVASDPAVSRREWALNSGADVVLDPSELNPQALTALLERGKADIVIVCAGALSAVHQALDLVDRGGTVLFFAPVTGDVEVPIDLNKLFWRNEITLTSSYAGDLSDHRSALTMIARGVVQVSDLVTQTLKLADIGMGFKYAQDPERSIKVIIEPQK